MTSKIIAITALLAMVSASATAGKAGIKCWNNRGLLPKEGPRVLTDHDDYTASYECCVKTTVVQWNEQIGWYDMTRPEYIWYGTNSCNEHDRELKNNDTSQDRCGAEDDHGQSLQHISQTCVCTSSEGEKCQDGVKKFAGLPAPFGLDKPDMPADWKAIMPPTITDEKDGIQCLVDKGGLRKTSPSGPYGCCGTYTFLHWNETLGREDVVEKWWNYGNTKRYCSHQAFLRKGNATMWDYCYYKPIPDVGLKYRICSCSSSMCNDV